MVINTNTSATASSRLLGASTTQLTKSLAKLSSGSRIVSPEDDAAGLAQSVKFKAQIHRNTAANDNVANALSYAQTQDGELQKMQKSLNRYSELAVLALDVTKSPEDIQLYEAEAEQTFGDIINSLTRTFNGVPLFQIPSGATIGGMDLSGSGLDVTIDSDANKFHMPEVNLLSGMATLLATGAPVGSTSNVSDAKESIQNLAALRAQVGSSIARLRMESETLTIQNENLGAANSRIEDVDVAQESTQFARFNILTQSGTAMLAQANLLPQSALKLLG